MLADPQGVSEASANPRLIFFVPKELTHTREAAGRGQYAGAGRGSVVPVIHPKSGQRKSKEGRTFHPAQIRRV